ncbi:conserved hypothetical protein (plasmid) [Allorhizobium ampelinum S4]|uniref:Uncharacterized protein n=1 Tax=Allorhizobium ampelinum (strain ATCC BAA-846 / DSM 112012 / S4) TaxID=311402 RepID=B9K359_ALLAM|nr:conserved hypothetical protein [Allorhizobium ampelinum S4]
MYDLQIVFAIDFVGRQDAELVAGSEQEDRDHQGTGEVEGVALCEAEIVRHGELAPSWSGTIPARWLPLKSGLRPRSPQGEACGGTLCVVRPFTG